MLHDKEFIEEYNVLFLLNNLLKCFLWFLRGIPAEFLNIFIENSKNSGDIQKLLAYIDLYENFIWIIFFVLF
jgi:hypothetical protein